MSQLIIRGASLRETTFKATKKSGQMTTEATFRASWSKPVCKEMGWTEEPTGFGNGMLEGKLTGISMTMQPNDKKLKDYAFDISINSVGQFKHVILTDKDREGTREELQFVVTTVAEDAHAVFFQYMKMCNPAEDRGEVRITFSAEEQMELEEEEPEPEAKPRGRRKAAEATD